VLPSFGGLGLDSFIIGSLQQKHTVKFQEKLDCGEGKLPLLL